MIILHCCGEEYRADESQIGRRIRCVKCGRILAIERHLASDSPPPASPINASAYARPRSYRPVAKDKPQINKVAWAVCAVVFLTIVLGPQLANRISHRSRAAVDTGAAVAPVSVPAPVLKYIPARPLIYTPRPETGSWVGRHHGQGGHGQLEITNDTDLDSAVKFVSASIPRTTFWVVYIRAHDTHTIKGVRPGSYLLRFAQGSLWDGPNKKFQEDAMFYEADAAFDFNETQSLSDENGRYSIESTIRHVTLNPVFDGNIQRKEIDEAAFDEGESDE